MKTLFNFFKSYFCLFLIQVLIIVAGNASFSQEAPQATTDSSPQNRVELPSSWLIDVPNNVDGFPRINIFSNDSKGRISESSSFFRELSPLVFFPLENENNASFFNPETNRFTCSIEFSDRDLSEEAKSKIQAEIKRLLSPNSEASEKFPIKPMPLYGLDVYLEVGFNEGESELLDTLKVSENNRIVGAKSISKTILSQAIVEALTNNPSGVSLILKPTYRFRNLEVSGISIDRVRSVSKSVIEDVIGTGHRDAMISREVFGRIKDRITEKINYEIFGSPDISLRGVADVVGQIFLNPPSFHDILDGTVNESVFIYTPAIGISEIKPEEIKNLVNEETRKSWIKNKLVTHLKEIHDFAQANRDFNTFHNFLKANYSAEAKGGIDITELLKANTDHKIDSSGETTTNTLMDSIRNFHELISKDDYLDKFFETYNEVFLKGEMNRAYTIPKEFKIYRIIESSFADQLSANIVKLIDKPTNFSTITIMIPLNMAVQADSIGKASFEAMKLRLDELKDRLDKAQINVQNHKNEIDQELVRCQKRLTDAQNKKNTINIHYLQSMRQKFESAKRGDRSASRRLEDEAATLDANAQTSMVDIQRLAESVGTSLAQARTLLENSREETRIVLDSKEEIDDIIGKSNDYVRGREGNASITQFLIKGAEIKMVSEQSKIDVEIDQKAADDYVANIEAVNTSISAVVTESNTLRSNVTTELTKVRNAAKRPILRLISLECRDGSEAGADETYIKVTELGRKLIFDTDMNNGNVETNFIVSSIPFAQHARLTLELWDEDDGEDVSWYRDSSEHLGDFIIQSTERGEANKRVEGRDKGNHYEYILRYRIDLE